MPLTNAPAGPPNPKQQRKGDEAGMPGEIERDHHGRPKILDVGPDGRLPVGPHGPIRAYTPYTRCSTMGGYAEDQHGLGRWRSAVALWGAFRSVRDTMRTAVMAIRGYDDKADKDALYGLVDRAHQIADIDHAADHGTALHALFEQTDQGLDLPPIGRDQQTVEAYVAAMARFEVVDIERFVVIDEVTENGHTLVVRAAGTLDRRVTVREPMAVLDKRGDVVAVIMPGDLLVVDIKTGSSADHYGVKYRLQAWLYAHGCAYDPTTGERTPLGTRTDWALILHVPAGGDSASWHWVDLRDGIDLAHTALKVREHRNLAKRSIYAANLDAPVSDEDIARELARRGELPPAGPVGLAAAGPSIGDAIRAEVEAADDRAALGQVYARWQDQWDPEAQAIVENRMRVLRIPIKRKVSA